MMYNNPGINNRGFRRSPHLQAVMDRIEQRRKDDQEKEIRWQEASRRRRNRQESIYTSQAGAGEEQDLSVVLETFAKYDTMLEHLVSKNMELMNHAESRSKQIRDDETAIAENVLNDIRSLRQYREQQIEAKLLKKSSSMEGEFKLSTLIAAGNPYLQFRRQNESLRGGQTSRKPPRLTPQSTRIASSFSNRKGPVVGDEEIIDSFRHPRKRTITAASSLKFEELLDIRELRERKRREAQVRNSKGNVVKTKEPQVVQENREQTDESEMWQFAHHEGKTKEERTLEPRQQAEAYGCEVVETSTNKTKKSELPYRPNSLEQTEPLRNELEEDLCWICPVDLLEARPLPPRNFHEVDSKIDPQTDESDSDSFGPSREAKKLKKRLAKIYQQNKTLRSAQEDMHGEMVQLQQGYKQKHNKLKRRFLRKTALPMQHQNEGGESENHITPNKACGQKDDNISYEVRDGVIVLDDIQYGAVDLECEFLGVHNPQTYNYTQQPITHEEDQAQISDAEWTYDHQGPDEMQSLSHNFHGGRDEDDTDDDDSMTCDSQSAYTIEQYQPRREPAWNCAAAL